MELKEPLAHVVQAALAELAELVAYVAPAALVELAELMAHVAPAVLMELAALAELAELVAHAAPAVHAALKEPVGLVELAELKELAATEAEEMYVLHATGFFKCMDEQELGCATRPGSCLLHIGNRPPIPSDEFCPTLNENRAFISGFASFYNENGLNEVQRGESAECSSK